MFLPLPFTAVPWSLNQETLKVRKPDRLPKYVVTLRSLWTGNRLYCLLSQPNWLLVSVADVLGFWDVARRPNLRDRERTDHGGHESLHLHPLLLRGESTTLALSQQERGKKKKKEDVFNPLGCCWFSNNKHESVSLILLYTANICAMCQLNTCAVRISHWSVSASITNRWKCAFVCVFACLHEQEREQDLNSQGP